MRDRPAASGLNRASASRRRIIRAGRDDGDDVVLGGGRGLVARLGGHERLGGLGWMKYLEVIEIDRRVLLWLDADECHRFIPHYPARLRWRRETGQSGACRRELRSRIPTLRWRFPFQDTSARCQASSA